MRRIPFLLIALFPLSMISSAQPAAADPTIIPANTIHVLLPTAETTWVVGKTVVVRWIRGKYPWMKVNIDLICQTGESGWGSVRIPFCLAKNIPDSGKWSGILKKPPVNAAYYFIRITRGKAGGFSKSVKIVTEE